MTIGGDDKALPGLCRSEAAKAIIRAKAPLTDLHTLADQFTEMDVRISLGKGLGVSWYVLESSWESVIWM